MCKISRFVLLILPWRISRHYSNTGLEHSAVYRLITCTSLCVVLKLCVTNSGSEWYHPILRKAVDQEIQDRIQPRSAPYWIASHWLGNALGWRRKSHCKQRSCVFCGRLSLKDYFQILLFSSTNHYVFKLIVISDFCRFLTVTVTKTLRWPIFSLDQS